MTKSRLMKHRRPVAGAALLLSLVACASGPTVTSQRDSSADFSQYQTFGYAEPLGTDREGYQSLVTQYLKAATEREMEARGLRLDTGSPQLLVNFGAELSNQVKVTTAPVSTVGIGMGRGYYGYRAGMYGAWPMYAEATTVSTYKEGTLNIDVVDAARKQLVWESVVTDSVTQKDLDNMQAAIDTAVAAAFKTFPIAAPGTSK